MIRIFALLILSLPYVGQGRHDRTVRARVQPRPGAEPRELEMPVHRVPVDPPLVRAGEVELDDGELVLGLVREERSFAFPIRELSSFEVLNTTVDGLPVAPTW